MLPTEDHKMHTFSRTAFVGIVLSISNSMLAANELAGLVSEHGDCEPITQTWMNPRPFMPGVDPFVIGHAKGGIAGPPSSSFISTNHDPDGDGPDDVVYTPDGSQVAVVHRETDNVTFFDANTRQYLATVAVGDFPTDVAITPNGQFAITTNVFSNSVSIINVATHALVAEVAITGEQPYEVEITPDSQFAVVGVINDAISSTFSVVDLAAQTEILSFPSTSQGVIGAYFTPESGGSGPLLTQFALTPDGDTIVLPNRGGAQVVLYSRSTGTVIDQPLSTVTGPTAVDISADGTVAVIAHDSPGNAITEIDLINRVVTGSFTTPVLSGQVVRITPDKNHAITGISNNVIFVNLTTGAVDAQIMTGVVGDIEISFDGQYAFVSNFNARIIHIPSRTLVATVPFAACVESACSPTALKAVSLNTRFREDIHFYGINGAASVLEGFASTGSAPEGDAARNLALSSDGATLVTCHNISRNVTIDDLTTPGIEAYVEVGDRPLAAEITPNGQYAVVCATDGNAVKVIDLGTNQIVSSLTISTRPSQVRISPDSQWAYVLNIAGLDQVSFIQLNGPASAIISQVANGLQAGSAQGYTYTEISGIELSSDGALLGVCDSFNDFLRLYDTATRTEIATVPVGDFPMRVAFDGTNSRAYVTNAFGDSVSVVDIASETTIATVPGIEFPLVVNVDASGPFAYAGNSDSANPRLYVIDTTTNTQVAAVTLTAPARDSHYSAKEDVLYLALTDGAVARVSAQGAGSSVIDSTLLTSNPSDLAFSDATNTAIAAQPIPDGVDIVDYDPGAVCPADIAPAGGDGTVDTDDLLLVINSWGNCPGDCPADINDDQAVNVDDLLAVINGWGQCQ